MNNRLYVLLGVIALKAETLQQRVHDDQHLPLDKMWPGEFTEAIADIRMLLNECVRARVET